MSKLLTLIILAGIIIESAEYGIFLLLSKEISQHFFSSDSPAQALLLTLGIFAAGYFFRPLAALLSGVIADSRGRGTSMLLSIWLAGLSTLLIGLLPSYQSIGIVAPVGLLLLRILQCMAIAGKFSNATIYLMEHTHKRKMFAASLAGSMGCVGMCLGGLLAYLSSLSHWQESWRIPFIALGILSLLTCGLRRQLQESPLFLQLQEGKQLSKNPIKEAFSHYKVRLIMIFSLSAFYCVCVYFLFGTYYNYLAMVSPFGSSQAKFVITIMQLEMALVMPLIGWYLSEPSSYRLFMLGATGMVFMSTLMFIVATTHYLSLLLFVVSLCAVNYAIAATAVLRMLYDLVPATIRCTSISSLYNTAAATMGGTTPLITQFMLAHGFRYGPAFYIGFVSLMAMLIVLFSESWYFSDQREAFQHNS